MADISLGSKIGVPIVQPVRTGWTLYTPTTSQGFGTMGASDLYWSQDGEDLLIEGRILPGTVSPIQAQIGLPINPLTGTVFTIGTQRGTGITLDVGEWKHNIIVNPSEKTGTVLGQSGNSYMQFSINASNSTVSPVAPQSASGIFASSTLIFINARIPCAQFAGMGTQAYGAGAADTNKAGLITTQAQTLAGAKTFNDGVASGASNPVIFRKILAGVTSGTQGGATSVAHGLSSSDRMRAINGLIYYTGTAGIVPGYTVAAGYEWNISFDATTVIVTIKSGNSAQILSKNFALIIDYV